MSQSAKSNSVQTASVPPEVAARPASKPAPIDAPRPGEATPTAEGKVVLGTQSRTLNVDRTAKLSRKSPVNVTAAKTAAPASSDRSEVRRLPEHPGPSRIPPVPTERRTIAPPGADREPVNLRTHDFGARTGVLKPSAVDQTDAKSGDWAIQFGAPKSEAEAAVAAARLNAKYAAALNGTTIGVRKTKVNGETIYALRAAGLSKADAMGLCVRVKGRDCSIIK